MSNPYRDMKFGVARLGRKKLNYIALFIERSLAEEWRNSSPHRKNDVIFELKPPNNPITTRIKVPEKIPA